MSTGATLESWSGSRRLTVVPIGNDRVFLTIFDEHDRSVVVNVSVTEVRDALEDKRE